MQQRQHAAAAGVELGLLAAGVLGALVAVQPVVGAVQEVGQGGEDLGEGGEAGGGGGPWLTWSSRLEHLAGLEGRHAVGPGHLGHTALAAAGRQSGTQNLLDERPAGRQLLQPRPGLQGRVGAEQGGARARVRQLRHVTGEGRGGGRAGAKAWQGEETDRPGMSVNTL